MNMHNGRSGSHIEIDPFTVSKTVRGSWEAEYMRRHPDVFVKIVSSCERGDLITYSMVRGEPALWHEISDALPAAATLLPKLWSHPWGQQNPDWQPALLTHLYRIVTEQGLNLRRDDVRWLVAEACHHKVKHARCIHGDPTLANVIYDASRPHTRWRWIDPLTRPYIPGDPLVDLGKLYQSCLGYEQALAGREPERDDALIECLADQLELCEYHGLVWAAIHLIRLIPYQTFEDKSVFSNMLDNLVDDLKSEHTSD